MRFRRILPALVMALPAASAAGLEVVHQPIECVPSGRYARVVANGAPAESVARAELQFRVRPDAAWYGVSMTAEGSSWSAALPRPVAPLTQFEYRVVMTAPDLGTTETPALSIRVVEDPAQCTASSTIAVAAPIVVRVPAGAPLVPPVPPGFSPAGVAAPAEPKAADKRKVVKWIAGGAAAAGIAAAAAGVGSGPPEAPEVSDFRVSGISPTPGSEISISGDQVSVFVEVSGEPRESLTFTWFFGLRPAGTFGEPCVLMFDTTTIGPERPVTVELTGMFRRLGFCATSFQSDLATLRIVVDGLNVEQETLNLPFPFRVVP
jgi:hypothetical protein